MKVGYFLSCEEYPPHELLRQAGLAESAGFEGLWISDHFHPWTSEQGQSPFVWSVIGALSQVTSQPVTTAVTCPTIRIHPANVAQAAATSSVLLGGRFTLGVGTGEALNEHILGDPWPPVGVRLEMLEEAVEVIRLLHQGGQKSHYGKHYRVENAQLYTLPESPTPIYVSAFGNRAAAVAGRIGDGFVTGMPDPEILRVFRESGGAGKPAHAGVKVCWARSEAEGVETARRLWGNEQLPGQLGQELALPAHFEQANQLVTSDMVAKAVPCGPDPQRHAEALQAYADAGYDHVYVHQIGGEHEAFFDFYTNEVLPRVRG